jgi:hypothetical protein
MGRIKNMKIYQISYEDFSERYNGSIEIRCEKLEKIGEGTLIIDNIIIVLNNHIGEIKEKK